MKKETASRTAELVCACRALEHRKPALQRVLDDPYAKWFLTPGLRTAIRAAEVGRLSASIITYIQVRHRYIDDALCTALDRGVQQVVIAGAGYDSRAYRFADKLAGKKVFELDFPSTSRRKAEIVAAHAGALPKVDICRVQVDFQAESTTHALARTDFDPSKPTFFIWEGVSMYLPRSVVKATLAQFKALAAPGSEVALDLWYLVDAPDMVATAHRVSPNLLHLLGEPIVFGIHPEDLPDFLLRQGLQQIEVVQTEALSDLYLPQDRKVSPGVYLCRVDLHP